MGPLTAAWGVFLSGTPAPALPVSACPLVGQRGGRISSDPSRGHMVSLPEAPCYGLAKLLLLSTVLFKYHVQFLCEGEAGPKAPSRPSPLL